MLTSLSVENFKSWQRIRSMRIAPITGLFGTNSSGKSGILQLLLLLKQTKEATDRAQVLNLGDANSYVNLGTLSDALHRHDKSRTLSWQIDWRIDTPLTLYDPRGKRRAELFSGKDFSFSAAAALRGSNQMSADRLSYTFDRHRFSLERKNGDTSAYRLSVHPQSDFSFIRTQGRPWDLPGPVKCYGFPDQVRTYYQNTGFLADLELAFEQQMDAMFYLGPLREYPRREYLWAGGRPVDVGPRGGRAIDALLAARARGDMISRGKGRKRLSLEEYVAQWLRDLRLIEDFQVEEIAQDSNLYRVKVRKTTDSPETLITDVGFGVSQILPVLVLLYYVPEGSTVLLEQPEIHLHPSVQSGLADVFIDAVTMRGLQIVLESHSEHLLRRLQRRVAEQRLSVDDLALYFCEMSNGVSNISPLSVDLFGNIVNWPEGFFGDDFGEIAAIQEAALRRKASAAE